jgi:hypothetical protein
MVFIQQKYEEALVDLYFYRAESAWTHNQYNKGPEVDEAIAGTYWVAQQNGFTYSEEQIQEKFLAQLDAQLAPLQDEFNDQMDGSVSEIAGYTKDFLDALREYYLNPCLETFESTIQTAMNIEQKVGERWFTWEVFFTRMVNKISHGLHLSFVMHGRDNKSRFSR